ncbi:hypothetical protein chiPu_0027343, partial [Chiloscyllium punctatum]|nr:hypothetical protein [Chiloscyllium punctatum]
VPLPGGGVRPRASLSLSPSPLPVPPERWRRGGAARGNDADRSGTRPPSAPPNQPPRLSHIAAPPSPCGQWASTSRLSDADRPPIGCKAWRVGGSGNAGLPVRAANEERRGERRHQLEKGGVRRPTNHRSGAGRPIVLPGVMDVGPTIQDAYPARAPVATYTNHPMGALWGWVHPAKAGRGFDLTDCPSLQWEPGSPSSGPMGKRFGQRLAADGRGLGPMGVRSLAAGPMGTRRKGRVPSQLSVGEGLRRRSHVLRLSLQVHHYRRHG